MKLRSLRLLCPNLAKLIQFNRTRKVILRLLVFCLMKKQVFMLLVLSSFPTPKKMLHYLVPLFLMLTELPNSGLSASKAHMRVYSTMSTFLKFIFVRHRLIRLSMVLRLMLEKELRSTSWLSLWEFLSNIFLILVLLSKMRPTDSVLRKRWLTKLSVLKKSVWSA